MRKTRRLLALLSAVKSSKGWGDYTKKNAEEFTVMSKFGDKVEIRLTPDTQAKFEKVATTLNLAPLTIVQMALGLGLDAIGANPNVVVDELRRKMRGSTQ